MNFKDWLLEGWGINYDALPADLTSQIGPDNEYGKKLRSAWINQFYDSDFVDFNVEDRASDFIKLEPLNLAKELPSIDKAGDKSSLPNFNNPIFYGFKFETVGNIDEKMTQVFADQKSEVAAKLKEIDAQLEVANAKKGGLSTKQREIIDNAFDKLASRGAPNFDRVAEFVNAELERAGFNPMTPKKISGYLKKRKEDVATPATLRKKKKALLDRFEELKQLMASKRYFLGAMQRAFLKKLKFPQTEQDKVHLQRFIQYAVQNYKRLKPNAHYDYVVYPQSRSTMASEFALALAAEYNAKPINALSKKNPTLDTYNLLWSKDDQGKLEPKNLYPQLHNPNPEERGKFYQAINRQMAGGTGMQIKNVQWSGLRPFIRNFEKNQQIMRDEGVGLKGRSILLVDDNAATGGTVQSAISVLSKSYPRNIDVYVPIYVDFY